jgi:hypothetical protein
MARPPWRPIGNGDGHAITRDGTMLLLVGYGLGLLAIAVQVLLAEWANRSAHPRLAAYPALIIAGAGAAAAASIDPGVTSPHSVRGLVVVMLGIVFTGVLVLLRALARELSPDDGR